MGESFSEESSRIKRVRDIQLCLSWILSKLWKSYRKLCGQFFRISNISDSSSCGNPHNPRNFLIYIDPYISPLPALLFYQWTCSLLLIRGDIWSLRSFDQSIIAQYDQMDRKSIVEEVGKLIKALCSINSERADFVIKGNRYIAYIEIIGGRDSFIKFQWVLV